MKQKLIEKDKLEKVITSISSSLLSHLYFCHRNSREGKRFHRTCIRQYLEDLNNSVDIFLK